MNDDEGRVEEEGQKRRGYKGCFIPSFFIPSFLSSPDGSSAIASGSRGSEGGTRQSWQ